MLLVLLLMLCLLGVLTCSAKTVVVHQRGTTERVAATGRASARATATVELR